MKKDWFFLFILFIILAGGIVTFFVSTGNAIAQRVTGIVTTISYVVWGILHHRMKEDLHAKVVIEYVLLGCIALVLLFIVIS
ncbi:hypothetical protein HY948_04490 [Candidatus Gottesmanbacteria bacterium]|nr:hypothetical protein [Candidatus Gottesmanbacteria bacterium]